ncbi:MAG: hypothetical protein M3N47_08495 [Chloroflexota bacterium]|nr:hypothetical protein [Chloroflexota bacterium]
MNANSTGANAIYGAQQRHRDLPARVRRRTQSRSLLAYTFGVTEWRETTTLRVAVDLNRRGDCFQVEAWAPGTYTDSGARPASSMLQCPEVLTTNVSPQQWNQEMRLKISRWEDEEEQAWARRLAATSLAWTGTWTLRVIPFFVSDWGFRLRVGLQGDIAGTDELVPPNLRAYPPYEFGFVAPASPKAGSEMDKRNPPGPAGISCTEGEQNEAIERGEAPPQRCLRLSAAMYNAGKGPLDLLLHPDSSSGGAVTQRVHRDTGGSYAEERAAGETRAAGEWTFHEAHEHSHYAGFVDFELYRVSNEGGPQLDPKSTKRLEPSVGGHKSGWHPSDQRMADWNRIDQPPAFEGFFGCREEGAGECITQAQGWGDHYRWQRPGNYVEFPTNVDGSNVNGDYVVRMVVDRDDRVLESRERDNSAYAWIRVSGEIVAICERGYGESPWDPHKRIHTARSWPGTSGTTADSPSGGCD